MQYPQDTAGTSASLGISTLLYLAPHSGHSKLAFRAIWSNIPRSAGVARAIPPYPCSSTAQKVRLIPFFLLAARIFAWEQGVADVCIQDI